MTIVTDGGRDDDADPSAAGAAPGGGVAHVAVTATDDGMRLDRWFRREYPQVPHARLEKWLRLGHVRVDGRRAKAAMRLAAGTVIRVPPPPPAGPAAVGGRADAAPPPDPHLAADLVRRVLWRDETLLILDKPAGLAVQGGSKVVRHLDALRGALAFDGEPPRLVHRLDRDTSGVLVLARGAAAARALAAAFRDHKVQKLYWAIVAGVPELAAGRISLRLRKAAAGEGEKMIVDEAAGQAAISRYRVIERAGRRAAWLAMEPLTGRTHQLRVHAAEALGTPILGDGKYGGAAAFLDAAGVARQLHLHARSIRVPHPLTGRAIVVEAPLPPHLAATFAFFGFDPGHPAAAGDAWEEPPAPPARRPRRSSRRDRA